MELPIGGILKIYKSDLYKYYKKFDCLPLPDLWDDATFGFKRLLNQLFYVAEIPFIIKSARRPEISGMDYQEYNKLYHRFEIERYGEKFDESEYIKYINEFKIDKEKTEWAKKILVKYKVQKMMTNKKET